MFKNLCNFLDRQIFVLKNTKANKNWILRVLNRNLFITHDVEVLEKYK
jgi:hypothetical protein